MRGLVLVVFAAALAFAGGWMLPHGAQECGCAESVEAVFSPGAESEFLELIESANESVDVELYQFSYQPLMEALAEAKERGARVRVILEPRLDGDDNLDAAAFLSRQGVEVRWASLSFARTHSKFVIVDGRKVAIGSHNWSYSAMLRNREAALFVEGGSAVEEVKGIFEQDWEAGSPA